MSQLSLALVRLGFLILLWSLVLMAIAVLRADIYGTRVTRRGRGLAPGNHERKGTAVAPSRLSTGIKGAKASAAAPRQLHLAVTEGPLEGTAIPLGESPISIGRAPTSTLVIDDDYCSARHARVYREGDTWWIEDLGSTNGTFIDDARLYDPIEAKPGIRIRLGATELEVRE
ncbi:MAG: FHA domain-containing protein [Demequinaceae bacterium]|nr:FHA domain-containing protein [Demequinaceae bacterium]